MVDLASVPASGSANFEYTVRTNLSTWEAQIEANANEIIAARDGETDLDTRLDEIEAGTRLTDNTITEAKLALNNAPTDNYVLSWNAAAGKPEWKTPGSAEDTGQVRMEAGASPAYLGAQIDDSTIVLDGSDLLSVPIGADFEIVSDQITIKQTAQLTKTQADSPYTVLAASLRGNVIHDNSGATGETIFQLPAGAAGNVFHGEVKAAQYFQVKAAAGETIRYGQKQTAAGGYVRCNKVGAIITARWNDTEWVIREISEYWRRDS